ncbi:MAG: pilus assembly protein [Methylobacterium sp.]|jgi:Flp pilus assembly protein TadG|nr:pilus assembly protein [Methylobacterium sp.]MCA3599486.1 pilus assembly protein [Methylobacterium sp.]MCA3607857.1 pilus assembly protein [Methylobacterium sp.]MCA3610005.1 pilus assembly protein [Methylobacterium sp.]MCA3617643.1 pilus assembly protein [Methylobacterium sp.]
MAEMSETSRSRKDRRVFRGFARNRSGASAVEFAMIAPLFFGFLLAMLETGTLFLRKTAIEAGVEEAKRLTMTGQVAGAGNGAAQLAAFQAGFCGQVGWIIPCEQVKFDVRAFSTFGVAAMPNPVKNGAFDPGGLQFNPGKPCQIVVIRAYYEAQGLTAMIRNDVASLNNGRVLLGGSAAFKNEPFGAC